jgi:Na+/proline symporter
MIVFCFVLLVANFIFLLLGGLLHLYGGANNIPAAGDDLFPAIAINSGLPFFITICFMIGLVSAVFPSADGALTALTSSFCIDILGIRRKKEMSEEAQKKTRLLVHNGFAVVFLACVFLFRAIDNGSLIALLLKMAGFTYGPLLGLFAFGILTTKNSYRRAPIVACIIAMILTLGIDFLNNPAWYTDKLNTSDAFATQMKTLSESLFGGYKIGVELLIINAAITFLMLSLMANRNQQTRNI